MGLCIWIRAPRGEVIRKHISHGPGNGYIAPQSHGEASVTEGFQSVNAVETAAKRSEL